MNKTEVLRYLNENKDPRGIAHWAKHPEITAGLKSVGIGLTRLRKFAKQIGRDRKLAGQLWKTDLYEAKVISLLIDDPKAISIEQAESQVEDLAGGMLAHIYSSCDATLAKTPFVVELASMWIRSKDDIRRRCGYGLLYEISKSKKKTAPGEAWFLEQIVHIEKTWAKQPIQVLLAIGTALLGIGMRSRELNAAALRVARKIGPIDFDPDGRCDPMDVESRLTTDFVRKKHASQAG